jgi:hypothetical protein
MTKPLPYVPVAIYFETFAQAIDGATRRADASRALLARPADVWNLCQEPLNYGATRRESFELALLRDKPTRKFFHVVLYRMDSGRYELTTYIS